MCARDLCHEGLLVEIDIHTFQTSKKLFSSLARRLSSCTWIYFLGDWNVKKVGENTEKKKEEKRFSTSLLDGVLRFSPSSIYFTRILIRHSITKRNQHTHVFVIDCLSKTKKKAQLKRLTRHCFLLSFTSSICAIVFEYPLLTICLRRHTRTREGKKCERLIRATFPRLTRRVQLS